MDALKTNVAKLYIPGCPERKSECRPAPNVFNWLDVADYLRMEGDRKQARRAVMKLRQKGWLPGFRVGRNVCHMFDDVVRCLDRMREERPA